jgi:signal transduction histidine kinase
VLRLGGGTWNTYTLHGLKQQRSVRVFERSGGRSDLASGVSRPIARPLAIASGAAHEIKTPLAAIKVQAQVALASHDPTQPS